MIYLFRFGCINFAEKLLWYLAQCLSFVTKQDLGTHMTKVQHFLLIMRHAKSDSSKIICKDFERPLNRRGEKQPKFIAQNLADLNIDIDLALVSPATRTKQTFFELSKSLDYEPETIFDQKLYNAYAEDLLDVLSENILHGRINIISRCILVSFFRILLVIKVLKFGTNLTSF